MLKRWSTPVTKKIKRYPIISFVVALVLFVASLWAGNQFAKGSDEQKVTAAVVKPVEVFTVSQGGSMVAVSGLVEKEGVIEIVAQSAGVVQKIQYRAGLMAPANSPVVITANTYSGASAASVQRRIAETQLKQTEDTFDVQVEILDRQKEVAQQSQENASKLREIADKSLEDTRDLIDLNVELLDGTKEQIKDLEAGNVNGANDQLIATAKQGQAQIESGLLQLRSGLRQSEYQAGSDNAPADLANLQRDIALKQLDIQRKSLEMSRELAQLQVKLARISESLLSPALPYSATVEAVYVRVGQAVNPGQKLATLSTNKQRLSVKALVPAELAKHVDGTRMSTMMINDVEVQLHPSYVSREATSGLLYQINYDLEATHEAEFADGSRVVIAVPISLASSNQLLVPLDALYQIEGQTSVFVKNGEIAESRIITTGEVWGSYIEVNSGLEAGVDVISTRNVVAGDLVSVD